MMPFCDFNAIYLAKHTFFMFADDFMTIHQNQRQNKLIKNKKNGDV
jgi:hypothetical protein